MVNHYLLAVAEFEPWLRWRQQTNPANGSLSPKVSDYKVKIKHSERLYIWYYGSRRGRVAADKGL